MVEITAVKKELILVLPDLCKQLFEIQNRTQCSLQKNALNLNLKGAFSGKKNATFYAIYLYKNKIDKELHSDLAYKLKRNTAVIFIMVRLHEIKNLELTSI